MYVGDPLETAKKLSPLLDMPVEDLHKLMTQEGRYQVELRPGGWKLDRETMQEIVKLELPGIMFIEEPKRYYPNNDFASHVIGFLNHDGKPVMGLEASLNSHLYGEDGYIEYSKDNKGNVLPEGMKDKQNPVHGKNIYLTIDERIQLYIENALTEANEQYAPESMTVIAANPHTGEILGMSSRPSFDPNHYQSIENYVNHAVSSTFEPGSTFKIITLAAAIEEGIYNGNEKYMSGSKKVRGGLVRDHRRGGWGQITFLEGVQKSSNVAFTILGYDRMPKDVFYHYISRFGFGELTGIDLPHESKGRVKSSHNIPELDLANMTFGQGLAVTAIQQVAAVNAIANGGKLLKPYIIDRIEDPSTGEAVVNNKPEVIYDQVVSQKTSKDVADILETVVTSGTGQNFYIEGYQVAGKTGTAQKPAKNGGYVQGKYIHSFIGFAPKDNPQIVLYVAVDSPKVPDYRLGGSVVAEIFKSVMQNSLQYLSVQPKVEEVQIQEIKVEASSLPDYRQMSVMAARQAAEMKGFEVVVLGDGATVTTQYPEADAKVYKNERIFLIAGHISESIVPDMTGWTLRELMDWANMANVQLEAVGRGYTHSQSIEAGEKVKAGGRIRVELKPKFEKVTEDLIKEEGESETSEEVSSSPDSEE
ncbi:penicillin-binding protein [Caldalkalibacillus mannanilyticus]|uniref:penicillin-binding protein n=1 Tax=Caldalkalibacillus mannanilyticus TaxID=1418 RepID=UPI0022771BA4|nr:PASTA domain-containing penicillin-binding protein [Caldalkalibacillus mannanilyticus]